MNGHRSLLRRAALMFAAHAKRIFLKRSAFWADGMEHEAHYIQNDWSALSWAVGCVFASYVEWTKLVDFLGYSIKIFLAGLILYFSCENFLVPVQALLCQLQLSKPALQLLVLFPIERSMCIPWPVVPVWMQVTSLVAGALYVTSAWKLVRNRPSIRWFIPGFAAGSIALMLERALPTASIAATLEPALLNIVLGRAVFPILVAGALWLSSANYVPPINKAS